MRAFFLPDAFGMRAAAGLVCNLKARVTNGGWAVA